MSSWTTCAECGGALVQGGDCLAHVTDSEFAAEIARLRNGGELDARGVTLNPALLQALFDQLRPDKDSAPQVPRAAFRGAQFSGRVAFSETQFSGDADFGGAQFFGPVAFSGAQFPGDA